jgi:hypothetical protein
MRKLILVLSTVICIGAIYFVFSSNVFAVKQQNHIGLAMEYIKNNTLPNGRFVYRKHANPALKHGNKKYNALRHAGALYSMYLCERYLKDSSLRGQRLTASNYFIQNYIHRINNDQYAVISKPEEEGKKDDATAKLGGSGLALISLSNLYPEKLIDRQILTGLGKFIVSMQHPDGNFASKYLLNGNVIDTISLSSYYPGEAALGLFYLNEVLPDTKWVLSAKKALIYLSHKREGLGYNVEFDHWAMLATWKLFSMKENTLSHDERLLLERHAEQMANSILYQQEMDPANVYYGSLKGNIRPCSIGTKMEGMIAIYQIIDDKKLKIKVRKSLEAMNQFLEKAQIKEGDAKGGLPTSADWNTINAKKNADIIQIDNVQHVLSAWILYHIFVDKNK